MDDDHTSLPHSRRRVQNDHASLRDSEYLTSSPPSSSQFVVAQKRHSSIPRLPPSLPIPSLPSRPHSPYGDWDDTLEDADILMYAKSVSAGYSRHGPLASPGLAALSQARLGSVSTESFTHVLLEGQYTKGEQQQMPTSHLSGTNGLLTPSQTAPPRLSSKKTLKRALELAHEAVGLDEIADKEGAIQAYGQSVALLKEVMERVMRTEDSEGKVPGLRAIHDQYALRRDALIDEIAEGRAEAAAAAKYVTHNPSPPASSSPPRQVNIDFTPWSAEDAEEIGMAAMFSYSETSTSSSSTQEQYHHPYAASDEPDVRQLSNRTSVVPLPLQQTYPPITRRRGLSALPPMVSPPPNTPLPPPPPQSRTPSPELPPIPYLPQDADQAAPRHIIAPRPVTSIAARNGPSHSKKPSAGLDIFAQGRTIKRSTSPSEKSFSPEPPATAAAAGPRYSVAPAPTATKFSHTARSRSVSQPGPRPSPSSLLPPEPCPSVTLSAMVDPIRKTSHPSQLNGNSHALRPTGSSPNLLAPPSAASASASTSTLTLVTPSTSTPTLPMTMPFAPQSPPPLPPTDPLRKPYHMMTMLKNTIVNKGGGGITRRLHVPCEVWSQSGAKLLNLPEKIRVVLVLSSALEDLHISSAAFCGAYGPANGSGNVGRKEGDAWNNKLDEFSFICDSLVSDFGKKLGVGEGFAIKKNGRVTNWGNRFARQFDKFTANGKNFDSPTSYAQDLSRLFSLAQLLDEHTEAINPASMAPVYTALPLDLRLSLEPKLKRASQFFASVVLTFVIRDLSQLLDKFAKRCEKWLAAD